MIPYGLPEVRMDLKKLFAIQGVFPAVKCEVCGAAYDVTSEDYIAFHGGVTLGLETPLVEWSPPKRPKKTSISVVCRSPECLTGVVRGALRCDPARKEAANPDALWQQVLTIWAAEQGFELKKAK